MKLFYDSKDKPSYLKRIREYENLEKAYRNQCIENGKKQEEIQALKKRIKELEVENDNFRNKTRSIRTSRQAKKI